MDASTLSVEKAYFAAWTSLLSMSFSVVTKSVHCAITFLPKTGCVFAPPPLLRRTPFLRIFDEIVEPLPETSKERKEDSESAQEVSREEQQGFQPRGGRH
jgi:hypothetical protein